MDTRTNAYLAMNAFAVFLIAWATVKQSISMTRGACLLVLISLSALTFTLFLDKLSKGGRLDVESNWGGLGGGLSGWRISEPLTFLLLSIGLFVLLVLALGTETPQPNLWERYGAALNFAAQNGIKFNEREVVAGKLFLKGTAPSQQVINQFWNQVKLANGFHDDVQPDLSIQAPAGATPGAQGGK